MRSHVSIGAIVLLVSIMGSARADNSTLDGMHDGNFIFKPAITLSTEYDDNIYTEQNNANGDFITHVIPALTLKNKDKARNIQLALKADQVVYASNADNNFLDYQGAVKGKYKVDAKVVADKMVDAHLETEN